MKYIYVAALAACLCNPVARAEGIPSGRWVFDKDATMTAMTHAGRNDEDIRMSIGIMRDASVDFTQTTVAFNLDASEPQLTAVLKCKWQSDSPTEIAFSDCVDDDGKHKNGAAIKATRLPDRKLQVLDGEGGLIIYRKM